MSNLWKMLKQNISRLKLCSIMCLALPMMSIQAMPQEPPINVTSDAAEVDSDAGLATHWGNVVMSQGIRRIYGEKLVAHRNQSGEVDTLTTTGTPAQYEGNVDQYENLHGQANRIHYFPQKGQVLLEGDAQLYQGDDYFNGPQILYDINKKVVSANGSTDDSVSTEQGRTMIVIQPRG